MSHTLAPKARRLNSENRLSIFCTKCEAKIGIRTMVKSRLLQITNKNKKKIENKRSRPICLLEFMLITVQFVLMQTMSQCLIFDQSTFNYSECKHMFPIERDIEN